MKIARDGRKIKKVKEMKETSGKEKESRWKKRDEKRKNSESSVSIYNDH